MTTSHPRGPVDATKVPRYAGPATFGRLARGDEVSRADVAILGAPFDGLTSRELLNTLRGLVSLNVVGADIVEVSSPYDHAKISGIVAAHRADELLSSLALNRTAP